MATIFLNIFSGKIGEIVWGEREKCFIPIPHCLKLFNENIIPVLITLYFWATILLRSAITIVPFKSKRADINLQKALLYNSNIQ